MTITIEMSERGNIQQSFKSLLFKKPKFNYLIHKSPFRVSPIIWLVTALSKCFPGAGYLKVGGSLGSQGTLSSVLRVPWESYQKF